MKPLLIPFTKQNPSPSKLTIPYWRSKLASKKSAEQRKILKKPSIRTFELLK